MNIKQLNESIFFAVKILQELLADEPHPDKYLLPKFNTTLERTYVIIALLNFIIDMKVRDKDIPHTKANLQTIKKVFTEKYPDNTVVPRIFDKAISTLGNGSEYLHVLQTSLNNNKKSFNDLGDHHLYLCRTNSITVFLELARKIGKKDMEEQIKKGFTTYLGVYKNSLSQVNHRLPSNPYHRIIEEKIDAVLTELA